MKKIMLAIMIVMLLISGCGENTNNKAVKIDENQAKTIALKQVENGKIISIEIDEDDMTPNYDVIVSDGTHEYDIEINAIDGTILKTEKKYSGEDSKLVPGTKIDEDKAKEIALSNVPGGKIVEFSYDGDDKIPNYDISIHDDKYEYDFEISAVDGSILSSDKELLDKNEGITSPKTDNNKVIGEEKAKEIALKQVPGGKIVDCLYDSDDSIPNYDITIIEGKYKYDIEINAHTGEILRNEKGNVD